MGNNNNKIKVKVENDQGWYIKLRLDCFGDNNVKIDNGHVTDVQNGGCEYILVKNNCKKIKVYFEWCPWPDPCYQPLHPYSGDSSDPWCNTYSHYSTNQKFCVKASQYHRTMWFAQCPAYGLPAEAHCYSYQIRPNDGQDTISQDQCFWVKRYQSDGSYSQGFEIIHRSDANNCQTHGSICSEGDADPYSFNNFGYGIFIIFILIIVSITVIRFYKIIIKKPRNKNKYYPVSTISD